MSKKIELSFASLNAEGQEFLTAYNKAECLVYNKTESHRVIMAGLRARQDELTKDITEAAYEAEKVRLQGELADVLFKMSAIEKAFKADQELAAAKEAMKKAESQLPAGLYEAYSEAYATGADGALGQAISDLLIKWGVDGAKNTSALRRFGSVLKIRIGGSRRASKKNRKEEGARLTAKAERQFNKFVLMALLDMFEVPLETKWDKADWEKGTESEKSEEKAEEKADAGKLFREIMKLIHPDNTGEDTEEVRVWITRATANRKNAEYLKKLLEEIKAAKGM